MFYWHITSFINTFNYNIIESRDTDVLLIGSTWLYMQNALGLPKPEYKVIDAPSWNEIGVIIILSYKNSVTDCTEFSVIDVIDIFIFIV